MLFGGRGSVSAMFHELVVRVAAESTVFGKDFNFLLECGAEFSEAAL
jgi:hypothetical protein